MALKRRWTIVLGAVLAAFVVCGSVFVIAAAWGAPGLAALPPATSEAPQMVRAQEVKSANETTEQTFTGIVRARYETDLAFRIGSKILSRHVEVGQAVKAGTLLFRVDATDYQLMVKAAQADLAAAEAEVVQASSEDLRVSKLRNQGAVSYSEVDKARSARDIASGRRDRAREALTLAVNRHSYCELKADADGVITALLAEAGQVVAEGQIVARLARNGEREAVVNLPENQAASARAAPATVTLWSAPGEAFPATLRELSPSADPVTRTYQARFTIRSPSAKVVLGMTATVHLQSVHAAVEYVIPLTSLYRRGDQPAVWVVDRGTGKLTLHPVTVRENRHDTVVLNGGVAAGLWVVTAGVQKLDPGVTVQLWENRQ